MRTIRRTVILLGCIGFITLFALQSSIALAVTPLITVVGMLTGLVVAKWLPWAWYGRQFAAGARAGMAACGLAAAGVLLSLVGGGAPNIATLAARSHVPETDLAQLVNGFGALGWFVPYAILTALFTVGGILLAGVVAQIFGWSKSVRTVRVIREAHNSASLLHRSQTWGPAPSSVPSVGGYWNSILPSAGPASHPEPLAPGTMGAVGHSSGSHLPVSAGAGSRARGMQDAQFEPAPAYLAPLSPMDFDAPAPLTSLPLSSEPMSSEPIPPRRSDSGAHPVQFAMTDDLRSALDRWGSDPEQLEPETDENADEPKKTGAKKSATSRAKTPSKRTPKASAYLNSEPPATPRRNRKKQDTRDWLC